MNICRVSSHTTHSTVYNSIESFVYYYYVVHYYYYYYDFLMINVIHSISTNYPVFYNKKKNVIGCKL